ncbi:MAG: rod shape-determining protein MreD [Flavobacteriales bacterium]|nr:rod shape-determining protein MreD [Flavobacteriales bacterium]
MIRRAIIYPISFMLFVLIQVFVLNNVQFSGTVNPFLYILFVLWLPIDLNKFMVLGISFLLGLSVDVFSDTLGMHTSAMVFLAFIRPYVLRFLAPRDGYEGSQIPSIGNLGFTWFLTYATICTFLHHFFLFFVEVFRFTEFFDTIWRILASSFFSIILILMTQFFHYNAEDRR